MLPGVFRLKRNHFPSTLTPSHERSTHFSSNVTLTYIRSRCLFNSSAHQRAHTPRLHPQPTDCHIDEPKFSVIFIHLSIHLRSMFAYEILVNEFFVRGIRRMFLFAPTSEQFCVALVAELIHYACVCVGVEGRYHELFAFSVDDRRYKFPPSVRQRVDRNRANKFVGTGVVTIADAIPCKNHAIFHSTSDIYSLNSKLNIQIKFTSKCCCMGSLARCMFITWIDFKFKIRIYL